MIASARRPWVWAILASLVLLFASLGMHSPAVIALFRLLHLKAPVDVTILWDTQPYLAGIGKMLAGHTPYDDYATSDLPFTYPPIFARVAAWTAATIPSPIGWRLYVSAYYASVVGIQTLLIVTFLPRVDRAQAIGLLLFAPMCLISSTIFWSGNMHAIWLMLGLLTAVPGLRRGQWWAFYAVMLLATINKPVFATLLIIPIFTTPRQLVPAIVTGALAALAYLSQRLFDPILYLQFQQALAGHLAKTHFYGQAMFGILAAALYRLHLPAVPIAAAVHLLFCAGVMLALWRLSGRVGQRDPRWLALLICAAVAMNPREMPYDAALGAIPAIFLILQLRPARMWPIAAVVTVISIALRNQIGFTALILTALAVGMVLLERSADRDPESFPARGRCQRN